ncbi:MAG: R3H domain-containing nucleic acid-binding protein [Ornithinimicrobium sp.]|uniref:Jag family protein n=1 Tax=Ornithinimicrobium sp. TaxID=1977084 RepID=UPI0026DF521F|nr:R3H domain-containing nucleic acid-binding protein [Ornithinimicrobium sp.]MDO5739162.1 R3H domain-containing nucleic acid-binding protein [Ornithinimicrobium sp.]
MSTTPQASAAPESTDDSAATTEVMTSLQETTIAPTPAAVASPEAEMSEGEQEGGPESEDEEQAEGGDTPGVPGRRSARTEDLVKEGEIAADFLEALLDIADLSGDLEVDIEGNRAAVGIVDSEDGAAPSRLVGTGGQVLEALQELTRLAVQAETGERSRLMLDVAGYRADRRAQLVKAAHAAISEVQESGRRRELEPMTAFERKVVHDEVLAAGLHSESEGVEPSRFVVILPSA